MGEPSTTDGFPNDYSRTNGNHIIASFDLIDPKYFSNAINVIDWNCGNGYSTISLCRYLHEKYPDLLIDGEMQVNYALNKDLRDKHFPFNRLYGKNVNTLVFPNLSAANTVYKTLLEMGVAEVIGPIQIGLNKPIHITTIDASVRDIVNLTTIAVIDAATYEKMGSSASNDK